MPIAFNCNECKTAVRVNENAAGKYVKCRKCGNLLRVPGEALPVPRDNSAALKWLVVGACALTLSIGGFLAWNYLMRAPRVVQAPPDNPPTADPTTKSVTVETPPKTETPVADTPPQKLPQTELTRTLLSAPDGSLATGAWINPTALLKIVRANIDEKIRTDAKTVGAMNLAISQVQAHTGLDLNNPQTLGITGLDLSQPVTLALFDLLPNKPEPGGMAIGVGLTDAAQFRKSVQNLFQKAGRVQEQLSAVPELIRIEDGTCLAIDGKEAFFIAADPEGLIQQSQKFLRSRKQKPMAETENMAVALNGAGLDGIFAIYADMPRIIAAQKERAPLASDIKGAAISLGKDGGWFLQLDRTGALYQLLKPGPSPKPILDRFEKPLVTVALSLADPVKLLQHVLLSTNQSATLIRIDSALREKANLGIADLGELLKDTSVGFMLIKSVDRTPFSGVLFVKPGKNDPATLAQIKKMMELIAAEFNTLASTTFHDLVIPSATVTTIDGIVFATIQPQLLTSYQHAQAARTDTKFGDDDFFMLDYQVGEMAQQMKRINPQAAQPMQFDPNAVFGTSIKRTRDGIKLAGNNSSVDVTTVAVIAAIAIPTLLRSRMSANEAAAISLCHQYVTAQAAYKQLDHDSDGVREFAQTLGGEFGLAHVEITQNVPFLPAKYAKAEGNPNDPTTPVSGYCIKILKGQGERAKGGRFSFFAGKDMTAGHAAVVYPKNYDSTGRRTFIVSHDGEIFSADLGADTPSIVELMSEFNPGPGWKPAE